MVKMSVLAWKMVQAKDSLKIIFDVKVKQRNDGSLGKEPFL